MINYMISESVRQMLDMGYIVPARQATLVYLWVSCVASFGRHSIICHELLVEKAVWLRMLPCVQDTLPLTYLLVKLALGGRSKGAPGLGVTLRVQAHRQTHFVSSSRLRHRVHAESKDAVGRSEHPAACVEVPE